MKKKFIKITLAAALSLAMAGTSFAGEWQWLDSNSDGIAECYYMENGSPLTNTTTPDGYQVNEAGAWIVNDVIQTQNVAVSNNVNHDANYDPAHPLAGKIDEWNLRLRKTTAETMGTMNVIGTWNVHAMLSGQMDMYEEPTGYGSDEQKATEQELYTWFCNWLNGMDFANMSEMQRAHAVWDAMKGIPYTFEPESDYKGDHFYDHNAVYRVLISRKGICEEYAMTTMSLAKAMGIKSSVYGSGTHAVAYIRVDGNVYESNNGLVHLDSPVTGDHVNWMYNPDYVWSSDY